MAGERPSMSGIRLRRTLGLHNGLAIIVGMMIGSGIFVSPKGVMREVHSIGASLLIWSLSGVTAFIGAMCYAELGTCITSSGSDYAYIREGFGPFPAFLFVWVAVVLMLPVTLAIAALTFANYVLQPAFLTCDPPANAVLLTAILAVGMLVTS